MLLFLAIITHTSVLTFISQVLHDLLYSLGMRVSHMHQSLQMETVPASLRTQTGTPLAAAVGGGGDTWEGRIPSQRSYTCSVGMCVWAWMSVDECECV